MPFSSVLGASSVIKPGVCTSTTRPSVPYEGQLIYETDTDNIAYWNGTVWIYTTSAVVNAQTAAYTLVITDIGKMIEMNVSSGHNLTVPTNSNAAFPSGTMISVLQTGAGQTTVAGQGGVTINATPGLKLRAQWSSATLIKRATDTWVLVGDLSA